MSTGLLKYCQSSLNAHPSNKHPDQNHGVAGVKRWLSCRYGLRHDESKFPGDDMRVSTHNAPTNDVVPRRQVRCRYNKFPLHFARKHSECDFISFRAALQRHREKPNLRRKRQDDLTWSDCHHFFIGRGGTLIKPCVRWL